MWHGDVPKLDNSLAMWDYICEFFGPVKSKQKILFLDFYGFCLLLLKGFCNNAGSQYETGAFITCYIYILSFFVFP